MDTEPSLQVLDTHSQLLDITKSHEARYYHIKVNQEKTWVPIPGFTIFTNIKNSLFQLSSTKKKGQQRTFFRRLF